MEDQQFRIHSQSGNTGVPDYYFMKPVGDDPGTKTAELATVFPIAHLSHYNTVEPV